MLPFVSLVVLNYNGLDHTLTCIKSLKKINYPKSRYEIIVVENGSQDNSYTELKRVKGIKLVHLPTNRGFTGGHNAGVQSAKGPYVMMLNNDIVVPPDMVKKLVLRMEEKPNLGIVGPVIRNKGAYYQKITFARNLGTFFFYTVHQRNPKENRTFSVGGVCMLVRKKQFPVPFDEDYFCVQDDIYLMLSAHYRGLDLDVVTDAYIEHEGGVARKKNWGLYAFHEEKNKLLNMFTFYETSTLIKLFPLLVLDTALILFLSLFTGGFFHRLKAYPWFIAHLDMMYKKRKKIQKMRKISDKEFLQNITYRSHYTPKVLGDFIGTFQYIYSLVVRLPVYELTKDKHGRRN